MYKENRVMLKPYERNRRIFKDIISNKYTILDVMFISNLCRKYLWEVIYNEEMIFHYTMMYNRIKELGNNTRVVIRIKESGTDIEIYSHNGHGINMNFEKPREYKYSCISSPMKLIMIDTNASVRELANLIKTIKACKTSSLSRVSSMLENM